MLKNSGTLFLFPSPISDSGMISTEDKAFLLEKFQDQNCRLLVEDHKPARRRWISWGLPREAIDQMTMFNEHTMEDITQGLIGDLKNGQDMVLMSDGGLPGFCDPGAELIYKCHTEKIRVHCRPFFNSVMLSLVLSGLPHKNFSFLGFPPAKKNERIQFFKDNQKKKETLILMDTPYRLNQICEEMELSFKDRMLFLAMDLDNDQEQTWLLPIAEIMKKLGTQKLKKEFVAIVGPAGFVGY